MYACMHVWMHACMHVCMYVCHVCNVCIYIYKSNDIYMKNIYIYIFNCNAIDIYVMQKDIYIYVD